MALKNNIPTEKDWGDYENDMDQKYAYKIFIGKSREQTYKLFDYDILMRTSDLTFMPRIPFQYYMIGFRDYIAEHLYQKSESPDVANCFITVVLDKLQKTKLDILPILHELIDVLEDIAARQSDYGAKVKFYGDYSSKLMEIKKLSETL